MLSQMLLFGLCITPGAGVNVRGMFTCIFACVRLLFVRVVRVRFFGFQSVFLVLGRHTQPGYFMYYFYSLPQFAFNHQLYLVNKRNHTTNAFE